MTNLKVGVLGGGSWGTTVASLLTRNVPVTLWARNPATVEEINAHHTNTTYLPGATLPEKLVATNDIGAAVRGADVVVMGIPSQNFRSVLLEVKQHIRAWVPVISLTKGLELDTSMRMTEIITEVMPGHPVGVLTGPNLAREIMAGQAAASVIAMEDDIIVRALQSIFKSGLFRVYTNNDVIGCELGGVLKNIIAIAVGMGDGQTARLPMLDRLRPHAKRGVGGNGAAHGRHLRRRFGQPLARIEGGAHEQQMVPASPARNPVIAGSD